jgi:phospholipase/carboxylesterase
MNIQTYHHQFIASTATEPAHSYTLLLLHGMGGDENDLLDVGMVFGREVNLLSVRGKVLENGKPRFFERISPGVFDVNDLRLRTDELIDFVREAARQYAFDPRKIIALGYANGANIAGSMLLMHPRLLAGAMLFRPMIPFLTEERVSFPETPILILAGKTDASVKPAEGRNWANILKESGARVDFREIEADHCLTAYDLELAIDWFEEAFAEPQQTR